jgi:hypothetical protein
MSSFRILIFFTKDRNNGNIWPHRMCEPIYCQAGGGEQEEANRRRRTGGGEQEEANRRRRTGGGEQQEEAKASAKANPAARA